jgi:hypothetical protein
VLNVAKTAKSHSSLTQADLFTVESAIRDEDHQEEDSKLGQQLQLSIVFVFFFVFKLRSIPRGDSNERKKNVRSQMYRMWQGYLNTFQGDRGQTSLLQNLLLETLAQSIRKWEYELQF